MALVREMKITYDSQDIPGSIGNSTLHLEGIHKLSKINAEGVVIFRFVVDSPTESDLADDCVAIEEVFQRLRKRLVVTLLSDNSLVLDDADYTGVDVTPHISKPGEELPRFDSNTSRLYEVTITAGLPANASDALRDFNYSISYTPSRFGQIDVSGTYTGVVSPATSATAKYLSEIAARVETIRASLGWTIELVEENYQPNLSDGVVTFARTYKQIRFAQSIDDLNHSSLVDPTLGITVKEEGSVTDKDSSPLSRITAEFTTAVDRDQESDLVSVWTRLCLPWIIKNMVTASASGLSVDLIEPKFSYYDHTISANVSGLAISRDKLIERIVISEDVIDFGKSINYLWPEDNEISEEAEGLAEPTPAYVYQKNRIFNRTVETITRNLGNIPLPTVSGAVIEGAVRLSRRTKIEHENRGVSGYKQPIVKKTLIEEFEIIKTILRTDPDLQQGGQEPRGFRRD